MEATVFAHPEVVKWMEGKPLKRLIIVKGRIINVVV
jgi:leucyl-tRNA synthetase